MGKYLLKETTKNKSILETRTELHKKDTLKMIDNMQPEQIKHFIDDAKEFNEEIDKRVLQLMDYQSII